jgi:D-glycero-alpha-D-manno-heptose-7-phosphate kinase
MIVSKTPLRMSFVGGGSDLSAFYNEEAGAVLSTSINKYMYMSINRKFDGRIRLSYSSTEEADHFSQIQHPLVREAMALTGIEAGVEIASLADIPSKGSGLGSSSSFTVGLLNGLYAYKNQFVSKDTLARQACEIEIDRCREPIGKQDQYAAAFGGLNLIRFFPDQSVAVDPIICSPKLLAELEASILVFFTGRTRSASAVLAKQSTAMSSQTQRGLMRRMVQLAFDLKRELESGSLDNFGPILHENWMLKAQLADGITDVQINSWYAKGMELGAKGGKLLGAGNGGFIMFFAPQELHAKIVSGLPELTPVQFKFDLNGAQIAYYQPGD